MAKKKPTPPAPVPCMVLHALDRVALDAAPPAVKRVLESIAAMSAADRDNLCTRLHGYLPPEWQIVRTAYLEEEDKHLHRMTNTARLYGGKVRKLKAEENPERNAKIIELWAGGPKVPGGRSAEQVLKLIESRYQQWMTNGEGVKLKRGAVQQVITRHEDRTAERRDFGL